MTAAKILQERLDAVSAHCMAGDWPAYRAAVRLPFVMVTGGAEITLHGEAELRQGFDTFLSMLRLRGVTDYIRILRDARFDGEDCIIGSYDSHLMRHAERVVPAYRSQATLHRQDGLWLFVRIANTWENARWPVVTPKVPDRRDPDQGGGT